MTAFRRRFLNEPRWRGRYGSGLDGQRFRWTEFHETEGVPPPDEAGGGTDDDAAVPDEEQEPDSVETYTVTDVIEEGCFLERGEMERLIECLLTRKNLILQGPPGTGKTWLAKRLAFALMGKRDDRKVRRRRPRERPDRQGEA